MSDVTLHLANHFLIAMPQLEDAFFARSVVYVCEHNERGALGLVINKPGALSFQSLLEKLELPMGRADLAQQPVFQGGPVQTDRGFVLHDPMVLDAPHADEAVYASTLSVPGGLEMTTSKDVLEAVAHGAGPRRVLVSLGYASWGQGQLESELRENAWLTVVADARIIFDLPPEEQPWMLHMEAGNA